MNFGSAHFATGWLRRADGVARAVHLWVKRRALVRLCEGHEVSPEAERGYVGGLLDGLSEALELCEQEQQMAAYIFCLLNGDEKDTLRAMRALLDVPMDTSLVESYLEGLNAAQTLRAGMYLTGRFDDEVSSRSGYQG